MSLTRWGYLGLTLVLIAAGAAWLSFSPNDMKGQPSLAPAPPSPVQSVRSVAAPVASGVTPQSVPREKASLSYRREYKASQNYWALAHSLLPAAKAGDADAEFYLSKVLERCADENRMYFERKGRRLSLDEGLRYAVARHLSIETAQSVFDRCHEFQTEDAADLGSSATWLAAATDAGQPSAQATMAMKILLHDQMVNFARSGGVPDSGNLEAVGNGADPRQLLRSAVKSKDPEILFTIGDVQGLLHPAAGDVKAAQLTWWLVACQRGLDCTVNAEWVQNSCAGNPACASANSPTELVRRLAGDQWPEVEERAQRLGTLLDTDQWDALDLGS